MRLVCALQVVALGILALFLVEPSGVNGTAFSFLGMPLIGLSILLYVVTLTRRRSGHS
jgi:hypothetical protein